LVASRNQISQRGVPELLQPEFPDEPSEMGADLLSDFRRRRPVRLYRHFRRHGGCGARAFLYLPRDLHRAAGIGDHDFSGRAARQSEI
jgi:hypothetical protein